MLAIFAGNLLVLGPYLSTDLSVQPWTTEYNFAALARLFRNHSGGWNSIWYGGFPFYYAYPPLFHAATAALPVRSTGQAYHVVSAIGYALVPTALYLFGRTVLKWRLTAAFAAVAYSIFPSPVYVLPALKGLALRFSHAPWSLVTLVEYGEGPHHPALAFVLLALAAAWKDRLLLATILSSIVLLMNWPGTTALGIGLLAVGIAKVRDLGYKKAAKDIFAVGATAYGLAAFWITPGYLHTTASLSELRKYGESAPASWTAATWGLILLALLAASIALWRKVSPKAGFLIVWIMLLALPISAYYLLGNHLIPEPYRFMLELNLGLVLAVAVLIDLASDRLRIGLLALAFAVGTFAAVGFLRHAWRLQPRNADIQHLVSYQAAQWLDKNADGARVFVAGELEGALQVWTDIRQTGGGTDQGASNPLMLATHREISRDCTGNAALTENWLRALAARYVVMHEANSKEYYHFYVRPERFSNLEVVWTNGEGDKILRLPAPVEEEAVIVDLTELNHLPALQSTADNKFLTAYVHWARGKRPASLDWLDDQRATIDVDNLQANEAVLVKTNYDSGWQAKGARIGPDPIGFLLLRLPTGRQSFELRYSASWDRWLGVTISLITLMLLLVQVPPHFVGLTVAVLLGTGFILSPRPSMHMSIAEDTFQRLEPPMISTEGIVDGVTFAPPPLRRGRTVSVFGRNFGSSSDLVRVLIGERESEIQYRSPTQINFRLPDDAPAAFDLNVQVNGCRGNAFTVPTRNP